MFASRKIWAVSAALLSAGLVGDASAQALSGTLSVTTQGGATERNFNHAVFDDLVKKTGLKLNTVALVSEEALARMIAEQAAPSLDLYQFTGGQELTAKARGLTQNVGDLGGAKTPSVFRDPDGQWVAIAAVPNGILYNTKYIKTPPTSFKDFFKPEYKGHVGIAAFTNVKGIDFMVMLAKTFGGSETNAAPGMAKIKELVDGGAKIFSVAAQMKTMFAQDDIWIAYYDVANALDAEKQGLPIGFAAPQEGMSVQFITNVIAKNSKQGDAARAAIAAALAPDAQRKLAESLGWTPVNPATVLPPALAGKIKVGDESIKSLVVLDRDVMAKNKADWLEAFNKIVSK
jgi:putative spermidine/putrescine transport system substrate-binding protein